MITENRMAPAHLLVPTTFDMKSINPNIVAANPRCLKAKGNTKRATSVEARFFPFISEKEKTGFSSSGAFLRPDRIRLISEKNPRSEAAMKGRRPDPGLEKLPKEASNEEMSIAPAKNKKKRALC